MRRVWLVLLLGGLASVAPAFAQGAKIFDGADVSLGRELIAANRCVACHQQKVGGDGSAIYRPAGRINTAGLLRGDRKSVV